MASSPPPAALLEKQPAADVMPSEVKHPSELEGASASELEGASPSSVETLLAKETLPTEKIPSTKAISTPFTEVKGAPAPPSAVEKPLSEDMDIASKKASAGEPFARIKARSCRYFLGVPDSYGAMLLISVMYAFLTPWLLRRAAGQPTAFVWTISILSGSYFFIGAIWFSMTKRFLAIFFRISYVGLLSVAATHFISSNSGAAVATLLTFYAAGIFGQSIAEYVQRAENENVVTPASVCNENKKHMGKEDQEQEQLDEPLMCFFFVHGFLSLFIVVRMISVVLFPWSVMFTAADDINASEPLVIVEELSFETLLLIWPWACFVALILQEGTVVSKNTMIYKVPAAVAALYILSIVFSLALGEAYGVLVLWPTPIGMVGLFGYILAMFARYNRIIASLSQDQPPMAYKVLNEPEQEALDKLLNRA